MTSQCHSVAKIVAVSTRKKPLPHKTSAQNADAIGPAMVTTQKLCKEPLGFSTRSSFDEPDRGVARRVFLGCLDD